MSDARRPIYQPETPRFTLRGMMVTATIVTAFAAIGGTIARRLPAGSQASLLIFWTACGLAIPLTWWLALRRDAKNFGNDPGIRFLVPAAGWAVIGRGSKRRQIVLGIAMVGVLLAWTSSTIHAVATGASNGEWTGFRYVSAAQTILFGVTSIATLVVATLVRRHWGLYALRDSGIAYSEHEIPWRHFHDVSWLENDAETLCLRRFDGNIRLRPAAEQREQVEAFIRERIDLSDDEESASTQVKIVVTDSH